MKIEIITSKQNSKIKDLKKAHRGKGPWGQAILIEGPRLIEEAIGAGLKQLALFVVPGLEISNLEISVYEIPDYLMQEVSLTETSQGMILVAEKPEFKESFAQGSSFHQTLLYLEEMQDPGNLGAMLRSALAFGVTGLFLGPGSCDPYHEKVLRSAMGAAFKLPFRSNMTPAEVRTYADDRGMRVVVGDFGGVPASCYFGDHKQDPLILAIGNEGRGVSKELRALADDVVTLPMVAASESLNATVAGSLLLYERAREDSPQS